MFAPHRPWILRAVTAGLAAALVGTAIGAIHYCSLPGATKLNWAVMPWVLLGFAGLSGMLGGLGIGGGMILATRCERGIPISARKLVLGSSLGGAIGCLLPASLAIAGFGSLDAPYAGTANIVLSLVVGSAVFVAVWAPAFADRPTGRTDQLLRRLGLAASSAIIACGAVGIAGWSLAATLGVIPSFDALARLVDDYGIVSFSLAAAVLVGLSTGAIMGFGTWLSMRLERAST
jgi:hypothetical protein